MSRVTISVMVMDSLIASLRTSRDEPQYGGQISNPGHIVWKTSESEGEVAELRVDAHQHFWNLQRAEYPWLTDDLAPIRRTIEPPELEPQLWEAGIDCTVLVQAANSYTDTDY